MAKSKLFQKLMEMAYTESEKEVAITCYFDWNLASDETLSKLALKPSRMFDGCKVRTDYLVGQGNMTQAYRIRGGVADVLKAFNILVSLELHASISKMEEVKPLSYYRQLEGREVTTRVMIRDKEGAADTLKFIKVEEDLRGTFLYSMTIEGKKNVFCFKEWQLQRLIEKGEFESEFIKYMLL